jgi:hypothetical protein
VKTRAGWRPSTLRSWSNAALELKTPQRKFLQWRLTDDFTRLYVVAETGRRLLEASPSAADIQALGAWLAGVTGFPLREEK